MPINIIQIFFFLIDKYFLLIITHMSQIHRVNYANLKHHREKLREQIDPKVIETIEVDKNPSQNYKNAFKAVYFDELEKTLKFQEEKRIREKNNIQMTPVARQNESSLFKNASLPNLKYSMMPLQTYNTNAQYSPYKDQAKLSFKDYDEERHKKFDHLIEGGYDGGQSFFKSQDQYQKRKQEESRMMKDGLLTQLQQKQNRRFQEFQVQNQEMQILKENRKRQQQYELKQAQQSKLEHLMVGEQLKQQAQLERLKKNHKSYFQLNNIGRHNPITNPIEYHIDNPYILQKYTVKSKNQQTYQEYQLQQNQYEEGGYPQQNYTQI